MKRHLKPLAVVLALVATGGTAYHATRPEPAVRKVWIPGAKKYGHFHERQKLYRANPFRRFDAARAASAAVPPPPPLPIDYARGFPYPILGNDQYGDCGPVACAHADTSFTGTATGKPSSFDAAALVAQYLRVSGGDNGTTEPDLVGPSGIWKTGLAGANPPGAKVLDHVDVSPSDPSAVRAAVGYFIGAQLALSLPDAWIASFRPDGTTVWDAGPGISANRNNGHYIWILGIKANGNLVCATWGSTVELTWSGLQIVEPAIFAVVSLRQFNAQGVNPNGHTYEQIASVWEAGGGATLPASPFPGAPGPGPSPTPPPGPTPPAPADARGYFDPADRTVKLPPGWTARPVPLPPIRIHPTIRAVDLPPGWKKAA